MAEFPKIVERRRPRRRAAARVARRWLRSSSGDRGPQIERRGIAAMKHIGGGTYEQTFSDDGPQADCWLFEDLVVHPQAPRGGGGLRPRRHDDVADHLRRDAPRLLRPEGPRRGHGDQLGRGVAVLPDVPAVLRPDLHRGQGPRARAGVRARPTTTGWSRSGAATGRPARPAADRPAVGRRAGGRRGATQRRPRRARGLLQRDPAAPRPAVASTPATGSRSSRRAPRPRR